MIDLHTHLLPGVDDGAKDWDEALAMLRIAAADGITALAVTPHQHGEGAYRNENSRIQELFQELRRRALGANIEVEVFMGGEVLASPDLLERLDRGEALTLNDAGKYLLLEFPAHEVPAYAHEVVFQLAVRGITPVIAHPERNEEFVRHPEQLVRLVETGALVQLTADSLSRRVGSATQDFAAFLLAHNLVHVMASDAHSVARRPPILARFSARVAQALGEERSTSYVQSHPSRILRGETVDVPAPLGFSRQNRRQAARLKRQLMQRVRNDRSEARRSRNLLSLLPWVSRH